MTKHVLLIFLSFLHVATSSAQLYPPFQVQVADTAATGYYFLCPIKVPNPGGAFPATHLILDGKGQVVYFRKFPAGVVSSDFKIQPNGWMSYSVGARFLFMDSTFTVVDSAVAQNGLLPDGHDIQVLPNGNYLILGNENVTMDLSAYPYFNPNGNSPGSAAATVRSGVVQELDPAKNVVFEWHAADHYDFADVDPRYLGNPNNVDWTHYNAVELDADGNILVSSRHFNEITKISRADSSVIWRLGGKANQFDFINDSLAFFGQHDARRIANGHLTLFDNGAGTSPVHPAAAKEYRLDEAAMTAELVWKYVENPQVFSSALGGVQRLDNGNTVINYGLYGNQNVLFNVVDSLGNKVFEVQFDDSLASYRSFYYPDLPWTLDRPQVTCLQNGDTLSLQAESGHAAYRWSTGANGPSLAVSAPGTYSVFVPKGKGWVSSEPFVVTDPATACGVSSAEEILPAGELSVFPNPATQVITVRVSGRVSPGSKVEISDPAGRKMLMQPVEADGHTLDVSSFPAGVYYLRFGNRICRFVKW